MPEEREFLLLKKLKISSYSWFFSSCINKACQKIKETLANTLVMMASILIKKLKIYLAFDDSAIRIVLAQDWQSMTGSLFLCLVLSWSGILNSSLFVANNSCCNTQFIEIIFKATFNKIRYMRCHSCLKHIYQKYDIQNFLAVCTLHLDTSWLTDLPSLYFYLQ